MAVDSPWRHQHAFAGDDFGRGADDNVHARLDVGIAGLADAGNAAALDADVGLDDAPVIDDQCIRNNGIGAILGVTLALSHAVAYHLAAAEFHFFTVDGVIFFDPDEKAGIGETHAIAYRGAEHLGISLAADLEAHFLPF